MKKDLDNRMHLIFKDDKDVIDGYIWEENDLTYRYRETVKKTHEMCKALTEELQVVP